MLTPVLRKLAPALVAPAAFLPAAAIMAGAMLFTLAPPQQVSASECDLGGGPICELTTSCRGWWIWRTCSSSIHYYSVF